MLVCAALIACHSRSATTQSLRTQIPRTVEVSVSHSSFEKPPLTADATSVPHGSCPTPADKGVRLIGRYDGCKPEGPRTAWSGSGFLARFTGTGLSATLEGAALLFTTVVDGVVGAELATKAGTRTYPLVTGLAMGEHTVELYRQGEASFGYSVLHGVVVAGELLPPPAAATRRLEIVGDSITAGYGNEGTSPDCSFSAQTENHYLTYGALLARSLDAELSTVAWSGKGVVSNYAGNRDSPMPQLYDRAEPSDEKSTWDFSLWQADAVLINLGTNDYSTDNDPTDEEFTNEYEKLLMTIRVRYPRARIMCTVGPLLDGRDLDTAEANIQAAVQRRVTAGDSAATFHAMKVANTAPGCDWHPGLGTHAVMAEQLRPIVKKVMGW
jgi:lysophospholipase L1-like esterase